MFDAKRPSTKRPAPAVKAAPRDAPPEPHLRPSSSSLGLLVQRAPASAAVAAADEPPPPAGREQAGWIVDDAVASPLQLTREAFLEAVREEFLAAAEGELRGTGWSTATCPWIDRILAHYALQDAATIEETLRRELPGASVATSARDYMPLLRARVVESVRHWIATQEVVGVPQEVLRAAGTAAAAEGATSVSSSTVPVGAGEPKVLQRRSTHDAESIQPGPDPRSVMASLGPGRALEGGVKGRLERAFGGASFGRVRVHTDAPAAAQAAHLSARAFTIGQHIAFAGGEYRPGTPPGDALIAHELAHTLQQRGAREVARAAPREAERAADRAAAGALAAEYGEEAPAWAPPRSEGLALRRCGAPATYAEDPGLVSELGLELKQDPQLPAGTDALEGMHIHYELVQGKLRKGGPIAAVFQWRIILPGQSAPGPQSIYYPGNSTGLPVTAAGDYTVEVEIRTSDSRTTTFRRSFHAVKPQARAEETLKGTQVVTDQEFLDQQETARTLLKPGRPDDQRRGTRWVDTSAQNPAEQSSSTLLIYWVRSQTGTGGSSILGAQGGQRFRWWAIPSLGASPPTALAGRPPIRVNEQPAYDLGTGSAATFNASGAGLFLIGCDVTDAQGHPVAEVRYLQSVLAKGAIDELSRLEASLTQARQNLPLIETGKRVPVHASHVTTQTAQVMQPRLYIGPAASGGGVVLVDVTPGLDPSRHTLVYRGADVDAALASFDSGNHYPKGALSLSIDANTAGIPTRALTLATTGASFLDRLSTGLGITSALLLLGAIVAAPFTGGGSLVVGALLLGSAITGAAAAGVSLAERLQHATVSGTGVAIDVLAMVGSVIGAGAVIRGMAAGGNALYLASRATRFVLWTELAVNGAAALLISVEGVQQIADILGRNDLSADEKRRMLVVVITQLILTGALLAISYSSMNEMRTRLRTALGEELERTLSSDSRLVLSLMDEATLKSVANASKGDLERLSAILRSDPQAIAVLQGRSNLSRALKVTSGETLEDLEWAFTRIRLEDHGVASADAENLAGQLRAAGLARAEVARLVALTPAQLGKLSDVGAPGLARLLAAFDDATLGGLLAHASGAEIDAVARNLGAVAVRRLLTEPAAARTLARLGALGRALVQARGVEGAIDRAVGPGTLILDNNAQTVTRMLMEGTSWASLQDGQRAIINRIRHEAGIPPLTADPRSRTLRGILGTEDVVLPGAALAEGAPLPGVRRSGLALSVGRDDPAWKELFDLLDAVPVIPAGASSPVPGGTATARVGAPKGVIDRAMVTDVFLGSTTGPSATPTLVTGDKGVYERLFAFNVSTAPAGTPPIGKGEALAAYIQRAFPGGFVAEIRLPASGRTLRARIIPGM